MESSAYSLAPITQHMTCSQVHVPLPARPWVVSRGYNVIPARCLTRHSCGGDAYTGHTCCTGHTAHVAACRGYGLAVSLHAHGQPWCEQLWTRHPLVAAGCWLGACSVLLGPLADCTGKQNSHLITLQENKCTMVDQLHLLKQTFNTITKCWQICFFITF